MKKEIHKAYQPLAFEDESMLFNIVITWFIVIDQSDFYRLPVIAEVEKKKKKIEPFDLFPVQLFLIWSFLRNLECLLKGTTRALYKAAKTFPHRPVIRRHFLVMQ